MKLFLDEAGHTGKHLFDAAQPLFVYAGVWLDEDADAHFRENLERLQAKHRIVGERKGSRLIGSAPGRKFIRECLEPCVASGLPVSVVVFDKPFQAAAVVVEDCTDYAFNDAFDERWTWDTRLKEPLAKKIYEEASPKHLMAVWKARSASCDEFVDSYKTLLRGLSLNRDRGLADLASEMIRADFAEIWRADQSTRVVGVSYSPNLNAFVPLVQGANEQAAKHSLHDVEVIHDEQVEYQRSLSHMFDLFRNAHTGEVRLPNGNIFRLPLDRLRSLNFRPSAATGGLQAADLVAASVRAFVSRSDINLKVLADVALWLHRSGDGIFPVFLGSNTWQERAFLSIARVAG